MKQYKKDVVAVESLTPEQYRVTQKNGTEQPGSGEYSSRGFRAFVQLEISEATASDPDRLDAVMADLFATCTQRIERELQRDQAGNGQQQPGENASAGNGKPRNGNGRKPGGTSNGSRTNRHRPQCCVLVGHLDARHSRLKPSEGEDEHGEHRDQ